ncbi:hypothetical protein OPV22_002927 [Ensete ventricosum]|uniref:LysM domain-containing protein n=1 Tax=Ensete ventricosum TaxID=4639 RepID=A0AAV8RZ50_ENSVE|nr:hypothetical protein OPV22_002927 [Ensete ventricosum]RWW09380.1 hypothetical protein GW17_00027134 [Ensete ventricosum]RWW73299.1 hypothetical protein BHE74_00018836 [Ensete ventricosum]RZS03519.1 hypothetical protein BHM03_00033708 [Ensete ventricosum]
MASPARRPLAAVVSVLDAASWYVALALVAVVLLSSLREGPATVELDEPTSGGRLVARPCDEIYVVGEGETLHTISDKCGDPFIVERNPHIHDPDDVFPGLVIKITPSNPV